MPIHSVSPLRAAHVPDAPLKSWHGAATVLGGGLVLAYVALSTLPGQQANDWVHLWISGRMVCEGQFDMLYNAEAHERILHAAYPDGVPQGIWPARNQRMGAFFYPPPAALYYALFAWLPLATAATAHAVFMVALALAAAALLYHISGRRLPRGVTVCALLLFPPYFYNYSLGQNAMVTVCVVLLAWCCAQRGRDLLAGVVLGLLVCKPNWLVALGWIPMLHGRWRVLLGMTLGAGGVIGLTMPWCGVAAFVEYTEVFREVLRLPAESGYVLRLKYSALGVTRKWFGPGSASTVSGWLMAAAVLGCTAWRWRGAWARGGPSLRRMMASSILAALWINPHLNNYDLVLVAVCGSLLWLDASVSFNGRCWLIALLLLNYVCCPWDNSWLLWPWIPVPSLALLALWAWSILHHEPGDQTVNNQCNRNDNWLQDRATNSDIPNCLDLERAQTSQ